MNASLIRLSLLAVSAAALHASAVAETFIVDNLNQTIFAPGTYYFTGTVTTSSDADRLIGSSASYFAQTDPADAVFGVFDSGPRIQPTIVPAYQTFLDANIAASQDFTNTQTLTYTGQLFSFTVTPSTPLGVFDQFAFRSSSQSFIVGAFVGGNEQYRFGSIDVQAVPEPATCAALALGGLCALRRRARRTSL